MVKPDFIKSVLLKTFIVSFSFLKSRLLTLGEDIEITTSALSISLEALRTPSFSIWLLEFVMPAVSIRVIGIPEIVISDVIVSRVVPEIWLVMLLFSPRMQFISVDLPTFGFPTNVIRSPCVYATPIL